MPKAGYGRGLPYIRRRGARHPAPFFERGVEWVGPARIGGSECGASDSYLALRLSLVA
jgi:hypothetical protein